MNKDFLCLLNEWPVKAANATNMIISLKF